MSRCSLIKSIVLIGSILILSSCGSQSAGGGSGEFTTVIMTAQAKTIRLESDVLKGNTCPTSATSGGTYETDNIDVDLISQVYSNIALSGLPVRITSGTVTYLPKNSVSPAIPAQPFPISAIVNPSSTATVAVPVVPEVMKVKLVSDFNLQPCTTTLFEYYATITFSGVEIGGSGTSHTFTTTTDIAIADRT